MTLDRTKLAQAFARVLGPMQARLTTVSSRDRLALWMAALAALVGIELAVIAPMKTKAERVAAAEASQTADQAERQRERSEQVRADHAALHKRLERARAAVVDRGVVASSSVSVEAVTATLFGERHVRVLRVNTGVTALGPADDAGGSADAAPAGDATAAAMPASGAVPRLFEHRTVVELAGPVPDLLRATRALSGGTVPWKLLRMEWRRDAPGQAAVLCTLGIDSTSATWMKL